MSSAPHLPLPPPVPPPPPMPPPPPLAGVPPLVVVQVARRRRTHRVLGFVAALAWAICAEVLALRAGRGIAEHFDTQAARPLLTSIFLLFLLLIGFALLESLRAKPAKAGNRGLRMLLHLPKRESVAQEWLTGAALGWALTVLTVLPMAFGASLRVRLSTEPRALLLLALSVGTLALQALAEENIFRGLPYKRLSEITGVSAAAGIMSLLFAATRGLIFGGGFAGFLVSLLLGIVLAIAYSRTHALWVGWGLHFALNATVGVLFGLRVSGLSQFGSVVETSTSGPKWLTGGTFGPEAAWMMALLLVPAIPVLTRLTREWSWSYTDKPIIAGGYAVEVAPPAAHTAMEASAMVKGPSLVQIAAVTPQALSTEEYISQAVAADRQQDTNADRT